MILMHSFRSTAVGRSTESALDCFPVWVSNGAVLFYGAETSRRRMRQMNTTAMARTRVFVDGQALAGTERCSVHDAPPQSVVFGVIT